MRGCRLIGAVALAVVCSSSASVHARAAFDPSQCAGDPRDPAVLAFFPGAARSAGLSGVANVTCRVRGHGGLQNCKLLGEEPRGYGFGAAALAMLAQSGDNPKVTLAREQVSQPVTFAVRFSAVPLSVNPNMIGPAHELEVGDVFQSPSFEEMTTAAPIRASEMRISGDVTLACVEDAHGMLHSCRAISEDPKGEGFAEHAIGFAAEYRYTPMTCDGRVVDGGRVLVPVHFPAAHSFRPH